MEKVFFLNTYVNYHTNGSNRSYWSKFFNLLSREIGEKNKIRLYSSFNENMPIYEYYSESRKKFVRVMQYNPKNVIFESDKYSYSRFYTAWIDKRELHIEEEERSVQRPELVVCLLMTESNIEKAEKIIRTWLLDEEDEMVKKEINRIYAEQDMMDEMVVNSE